MGTDVSRWDHSAWKITSLSPLGVSIWRKGSAGLLSQDLTSLLLATRTLPSRNSIHYLMRIVGRIAGNISEAQLREHTGSSTTWIWVCSGIARTIPGSQIP